MRCFTNITQSEERAEPSAPHSLLPAMGLVFSLALRMEWDGNDPSVRCADLKKLAKEAISAKDTETEFRAEKWTMNSSGMAYNGITGGIIHKQASATELLALAGLSDLPISESRVPCLPERAERFYEFVRETARAAGPVVKMMGTKAPVVRQMASVVRG